MYEMWAEAGQNLDAFWELSPRHFQHVMRGIRRRLTAGHDQRITQAWQAGAFAGLAQSKGGLKPLDHYLRRPPRQMSAEEMLSTMQAFADRQNSKQHAS